MTFTKDDKKYVMEGLDKVRDVLQTYYVAVDSAVGHGHCGGKIFYEDDRAPIEQAMAITTACIERMKTL